MMGLCPPSHLLHRTTVEVRATSSKLTRNPSPASTKLPATRKRALNETYLVMILVTGPGEGNGKRKYDNCCKGPWLSKVHHQLPATVSNYSPGIFLTVVGGLPSSVPTPMFLFSTFTLLCERLRERKGIPNNKSFSNREEADDPDCKASGMQLSPVKASTTKGRQIPQRWPA